LKERKIAETRGWGESHRKTGLYCKKEEGGNKSPSVFLPRMSLGGKQASLVAQTRKERQRGDCCEQQQAEIFQEGGKLGPKPHSKKKKGKADSARRGLVPLECLA